MDFSKINRSTKIVFLVIGIILILNLFALLFNRGSAVTENATNNSDVINEITNRTSDDYFDALSYPVDLNSWNGKVLLRPKNFLTLQTYESVNEGCGLVENMKVYYSSNLKDILIVSNKNLQKNQEQRRAFEDAAAIITTGEFPDDNAELTTFKNYCSSANLNIVTILPNKIENFDSTQVVLGVLNGKNRFSNSLDDVGVYIYVYGKKNDYLTFFARSYFAKDFISESSFQQCKDAKLDDRDCIKRFYDRDASIRSKIESEVSNILSTYSFNE